MKPPVTRAIISDGEGVPVPFVPSAQYSDQVTLTARITSGAPLATGEPQAAQSVTFRIGGQIMNTTPAALTIDGNNLVATWTGSLMETTNSILLSRKIESPVKP